MGMLPDGMPSLVALCVIALIAWIVADCRFKNDNALSIRILKVHSISMAEASVFWPWAVANSIARKGLDGGAVTFFIVLVCTYVEMRRVLGGESIQYLRWVVTASYFLVCLNYIGGAIVFDETLLIIYCVIAATLWLVLCIVHVIFSSKWNATVSAEKL